MFQKKNSYHDCTTINRTNQSCWLVCWNSSSRTIPTWENCAGIEHESIYACKLLKTSKKASHPSCPPNRRITKCFFISWLHNFELCIPIWISVSRIWNHYFVHPHRNLFSSVNLTQYSGKLVDITTLFQSNWCIIFEESQHKESLNHNKHRRQTPYYSPILRDYKGISWIFLIDKLLCCVIWQSKSHQIYTQNAETDHELIECTKRTFVLIRSNFIYEFRTKYWKCAYSHSIKESCNDNHISVIPHAESCWKED